MSETKPEVQVKEELSSAFTEALNRTKAEVEQMKEKLKKYDEQYEASKTVKEGGKKAHDFFKTTLEEILKTLETLREKAKEVFDQSKEVTASTVKDLWEKLQNSINDLKKKAKEIDEEHKVTEKVTELSAPLLKTLSSMQSSLDKAIETAKGASESGRSYLIGAAASLEHKYKLESRIKGIDEKYGLLEKAKKVQERGEEFLEKQHIVERMQELDEKFTKSKISNFVESGMKKVNEIVASVEKDYETAKEMQSKA